MTSDDIVMLLPPHYIPSGGTKRATRVFNELWCQFVCVRSGISEQSAISILVALDNCKYQIVIVNIL